MNRAHTSCLNTLHSGSTSSHVHGGFCFLMFSSFSATVNVKNLANHNFLVAIE